MYVTHAGDGSGRLFVVERRGKIWAIEHGERMEEPFLDVSHLTSHESDLNYSEIGLLGLAFHPKYTVNGFLYIYYTDESDRATVIERYQVSEDDPDKVDPKSGQLILHHWQPKVSHNGGHLAFGPDGYLYVGMGDGGTRGDQLGAGQNRQILLGSILRLDVDSGLPYTIPPDNPFVNDGAARSEIWAYGLRNPWRFSFDRLTGDLYIGDVGLNRWEEVNFQPADSAGGANYGWNIKEGHEDFAGGTLMNYVPPIFTYGHEHGCSVIGGYVYRGAAIPKLQSVYLFGDFCSGRIWATWIRSGDMKRSVIELTKLDIAISSFGEDEAGEVYVIDYGGTVYRLDPADA